jgi:VWFA-related protein
MPYRMNLLRALILAALLPLLAFPPSALRARAQQQGPVKTPPQEQAPPKSPPQKKPEYSISVEAPIVNVDVVVTDQAGDIITGLKKPNFRILEDGADQTITNFTPSDAPITIVVLMEFSRIAYGFFYATGTGSAPYWSSEFIDNLGPRDYAAIITFDLKMHIQQDFTHNKDELKDAIRRLYLPDFRESILFDSVCDTLDRLQEVKGKKSILLLATGFDSFSKHTLDQTYKRLQETDVTIFAVGIAENYFDSAIRNHGLEVSYLQAKNQLNNFAESTGGYAWFPRFDGELPDIFHSVTAFLRNQYTLAYSPSNAANDGKFHKIKVEVLGDDGQPLEIANKKGKKQKVVVYARRGYLATKAAVN